MEKERLTKEIIQNATKIILEKIYSDLAKSTVQFFHYMKGNKIPVGAGSGVLISDGKNYFIFTAAHVLSEGQISNLFINLHGPDSLPLTMPYMITSLPEGKKRNDDVYDVGVLLLRDADVQKILTLGSVFIDYNILLLDYEAKKTDEIICLGFPSTSLKLDMKENSMTQKYLVFPNHSIVYLKEKYNRLTSRDHVLVHYPKKNLKPLFSNQHITGPDPHGLSGGGMWLFEGNGSTISAYLVAIMTEIENKRSYFIGTKVKFFVESLKNNLDTLLQLREEQEKKM